MKYLALLLLLVSTAASADIFRPWAREEMRTDYIGAAADDKPIQGVKRGSKILEYDTGKAYRWKGSEERGSTSDWYEVYDPMSLGTRLAGERNTSSTTGTDYASVSSECKPSGEIDISAGSGTIYNGPAIVQWVQVSTTPGTAASSIDDNATAKIPLPVSFPVGVYPVNGTVFCTSLKYTRGASATGKMNVCYRPLDSAQVTWACP